VASLKPKLFCGVAFMARSFLLREYVLERLTGVGRDAYHYATIIVKRPNCSGRATPPHLQNQLDVALFDSDCESETGDYKGVDELCQAQLLQE